MRLVDLVYTCKAEDDLDSIFDYIAEDSVLNARNFSSDAGFFLRAKNAKLQAKEVGHYPFITPRG